MTRADLEVVITSQRPDLEDQIRDAFHGEWPEFIFHDPVSNEYTGRVQRYFTHLDLTLLDRGQVVAGGWGVPLAWDQSLSGLPTGYDGALVSSVTGHETGVEPNTLVVMAAAVQADRRGQGLASEVLGPWRSGPPLQDLSTCWRQFVPPGSQDTR